MKSPQDWTQCISDWKRNTASLSYEEALQAFDLLLADLQSDSVSLADLQKHVVHGEIYLNHCEALLKAVEASVVQLDPENFQPVSDSTPDDA